MRLLRLKALTERQAHRGQQEAVLGRVPGLLAHVTSCLPRSHPPLPFP